MFTSVIEVEVGRRRRRESEVHDSMIGEDQTKIRQSGTRVVQPFSDKWVIPSLRALCVLCDGGTPVGVSQSSVLMYSIHAP